MAKLVEVLKDPFRAVLDIKENKRLAKGVGNFVGTYLKRMIPGVSTMEIMENIDTITKRNSYGFWDHMSYYFEQGSPYLIAGILAGEEFFTFNTGLDFIAYRNSESLLTYVAIKGMKALVSQSLKK